jgi:hypothetical protein
MAMGLGAWFITRPTTSHAADHLDSPTLMSNPMADINDVYAWMTPDALKVNLAMSISPNDDGRAAGPASTRHFGPSILYTFHVSSVSAFGMPGTETLVMCKFASDNDVECWVGDRDYVHGNPSSDTGVTSTSGKVKVFAGLRSDPFFFNLQGYRDAVTLVNATTTPTKDTAGCPQLTDVQGLAIRNKLNEAAQAGAAAPCSTTSKDCFSGLNVKMIVLQIDKNLLNLSGHTLLSVWAGTNMVGA